MSSSLFAVALIAASACGSSSISRSTLTKSIVASAKKDGADIDEGCVGDAVAKFTDKDMKIVDAAIKSDSDPTGLSADAQAVMLEIVSCAGSASGLSIPPAIEGLSALQSLMLNQILSSLESSGTKVDEACLTELVKKLTNDDLVNASSAVIQKLTTDAQACLQG